MLNYIWTWSGVGPEQKIYIAVDYSLV